MGARNRDGGELVSHPWLTPYRARSGFLAPWQAEILAAWRHARATGRNAMVISKDSLLHSQEWWKEAERKMGERLVEELP